ncbi:MAG: hypothetical protein ABI556_08555, partial [Gemmatimonadales bacterium]
GSGNVYGIGTASQVIELEKDVGDVANLYTNIAASAGDSYTISFDYSPRAGNVSNSGIGLYWGGNLIGHLSGATAGMQHFAYTVTATADNNYRLEFRADDSNSHPENLHMTGRRGLAIRGMVSNPNFVAVSVIERESPIVSGVAHGATHQVLPYCRWI